MPPTILIADDDTELCELLREYLGMEGFEVRLAFDGEQALAESRRPGLDAMVLDIMMPRMNGIDVLRNLRKESELPVIMLTARGDDIDRMALMTTWPNQPIHASCWHVSAQFCGAPIPNQRLRRLRLATWC